MHRLMLIAIILIGLPVVAAAQTADGRRGQGYVFVAPGGATNRGTQASLHVGGGGEYLVDKGFGVGGEAGYFGPVERINAGLAVVSANSSYHFSQSGSKLVPFVTAGYSLLFRSDSANAFNVGGGINYWFRDGVGLRLEFRDHVRPDSRGTTHYYGFRIGLSFR